MLSVRICVYIYIYIYISRERRDLRECIRKLETFTEKRFERKKEDF